MLLDLQKLAAGVAAIARHPASGVRRQCQLRDSMKVLQFLTALRSGCLRARAAKVAGISEATMRLWCQEAKKPRDIDGPHPYESFLIAVQAVETEREELRRPTPPPVVAVDVSAVRAYAACLEADREAAQRTPRPSPVAPVAFSPAPVDRPAAPRLTEAEQFQIWRDIEQLRTEMNAADNLRDGASAWERQQQQAKLRAIDDKITALMSRIQPCPASV